MAIMVSPPATSRASESRWASLDADLELGMYEIWRGYVILELVDTGVGSLDACYFPRGRGRTILGPFLTKTRCLAIQHDWQPCLCTGLAKCVLVEAY